MHDRYCIVFQKEIVTESFAVTDMTAVKATFHLTISMRGSEQRAKFKGIIITITGVADLL